MKNLFNAVENVTEAGSRCLCSLLNDDSEWFKLFGFDQAAVGREARRAEEAEQWPFAGKMDEQ